MERPILPRSVLIQQNAILDILEERIKQDEKWGVQNHDIDHWLVILMEEVGETAEAALERKPSYRAEMVQVAAVALSAIESWDRNSASTAVFGKFEVTTIPDEQKVDHRRW